jgi:hypothetical protein
MVRVRIIAVTIDNNGEMQMKLVSKEENSDKVDLVSSVSVKGLALGRAGCKSDLKHVHYARSLYLDPYTHLPVLWRWGWR